MMKIETAMLFLATFSDAELIVATSGEVKILEYSNLKTEYTVSKVYFGGRQVVAEWRPDGESWRSTPVPRKWDWED